jgi:hypothetical protein
MRRWNFRRVRTWVNQTSLVLTVVTLYEQPYKIEIFVFSNFILLNLKSCKLVLMQILRVLTEVFPLWVCVCVCENYLLLFCVWHSLDDEGPLQSQSNTSNSWTSSAYIESISLFPIQGESCDEQWYSPQAVKVGNRVQVSRKKPKLFDVAAVV